MKWWDWMPRSSFFECWVLSQLVHSPVSPSLRGSLVQGWEGDKDRRGWSAGHEKSSCRHPGQSQTWDKGIVQAPDPWGQRAPAPQGSICHLPKQWEQEGRRQTERREMSRFPWRKEAAPLPEAPWEQLQMDAAEGENVWISLFVFGVNPRALWSQKIIEVKEHWQLRWLQPASAQQAVFWEDQDHRAHLPVLTAEWPRSVVRMRRYDAMQRARRVGLESDSGRGQGLQAACKGDQDTRSWWSEPRWKERT